MQGRIVYQVWEELPRHYPGVEIDAFVVMPNHLHGIVLLTEIVEAGPRACPNEIDDNGQPQRVAPTLSLPDVVHRFKSLTTTQYRHGMCKNGWHPIARRLWQRNYYEHVVRDEDDLNRIRQYIIDNPVCWAEDDENPINIT